MSSNFSFARNPIPVDSRREDWPRLVADDLNGIVRAYIFTFSMIATPTAAEIIWIQPVSHPFSIPANWGPMTNDGLAEYASVIPSIDTAPAATWTMTIAHKLRGETSYTTIGTWTVTTGKVFTATTAGNVQKDIAKGDVLKFTSQPSADGTIKNCAFTVVGMR